MQRWGWLEVCRAAAECRMVAGMQGGCRAAGCLWGYRAAIGLQDAIGLL